MENVVKPPQKPIISRIRKLVEGIIFVNSPMQKHPIRLMRNVPKGKANSAYFATNTDTKYLIILPAAPPSPTNKIGFIIRTTNLEEFIQTHYIIYCRIFYYYIFAFLFRLINPNIACIKNTYLP